jgi:hypothetical protein
MGETSADTQREIESLRERVSETVGELERRARRTFNLKAQAEAHPGAVSIVGVGLLGGIGLAAFNAVSGYRESRKPINRVRRRGREVADDLGERWTRTRDRLPLQVYVTNDRKDDAVDTKQDPGILKTLLWMGLTAGTVALFGLLARRVSSAIWELVMREPPPTSKV